jgi:CubicO group peptidase (beta-lactamase class C family)
MAVDPEAAAHAFEAWRAALNAADRAKLAAVFERAAAPGVFNTVDDAIQFARMTGGFDLVAPDPTTTATVYKALVRERDGEQYARAELVVDASPPHKVTKFSLLAVPTPDAYRPPVMTEADALAALRAELEKQRAKDRFAGTVLVAKNGKPVFAEAYGLADREKKVPVTLATQFRIGSMNKMFTATALMQLVQAKKVTLATTVGKLMPGYPNKTVADKVTLHHLLTHTGGTGDIFGPEYDKHRLELKTLDDYVKLYGEREPAYEPGEKFAYSNYGFLLAGVMIEKATKRSYYDIVQERVFKPAGMTATASLAEDQPVPARSVGYMHDDQTGAWTPNTDTLPYRGTSAGGGYSTVEDLLKFANALRANKLLDAKHTQLLGSAQTTREPGVSYGYGFTAQEINGVRCIGHGGGAPGMNGELRICDSGYTVVVLANLDPPAANRIADFITARLPTK